MSQRLLDIQFRWSNHVKNLQRDLVGIDQVHSDIGFLLSHINGLENDITEAIRDAVAEERAACAKIAEEEYAWAAYILGEGKNDIADVIRARGKGET